MSLCDKKQAVQYDAGESLWPSSALIVYCELPLLLWREMFWNTDLDGARLVLLPVEMIFDCTMESILREVPELVVFVHCLWFSTTATLELGLWHHMILV